MIQVGHADSSADAHYPRELQIRFRTSKQRKPLHFLKPQDVNFHMVYHGYLRIFFNREKCCICVCIVLVQLWTTSTENQWEISKVGCLSCFIECFAWFHIICGHQIRFISPFRHFSYHFHFHPTFALIPKLILTLRHILIYRVFFLYWPLP